MLNEVCYRLFTFKLLKIMGSMNRFALTELVVESKKL